MTVENLAKQVISLIASNIPIFLLSTFIVFVSSFLGTYIWGVDVAALAYWKLFVGYFIIIFGDRINYELWKRL